MITNLSIPFKTDIKNNNFELNMDDSLKVSIKTSDFPLDFVNLLLPPKNNLRAKIDVDIDVEGTIKAPLIDGKISMGPATFNNTMFGMRYNNINADIQFDHKDNSNTISINDFSFQTGRRRNRGSFSLRGFSTILVNDSSEKNKSLIEIAETRLNLRMNNLQLTDHRAIRTNLSGNFALSNIPSTETEHIGKLLFMPKFRLQGNVTTNEIKANIDELQKITMIEIVPEPLLVAARNQSGTNAQVLEESIPFKLPEFEVNFRVTMPRNVWVQSREMSLELSGTGDYRINQNNQFIHGNVEVVRGYIEYFTRRFTIEEGIVIVRGTELRDIEMIIKANYHHRDTNRNSSIITLALDGSLENPSIKFYQDGDPIEEADALALIVFGKKMEGLMDEGLDSSMMTELGTGLITAEVSNAIQRQLGLDVVSINLDPDRQATLTIGNYIGRRLFVSYERAIDYSDFNTIQADRVNIEYQIGRNIYLITTQGVENENGIDLIFRWQKNENSSRRY
jgi:autotransporter translocation and assembly factor TamB